MRTCLLLFLAWIFQNTVSEAVLIKSSPSYVSGWRSMTANSPTSRVTFHHHLQEDPVYVKVNARTDNGFIFPAFGSAQQDDDSLATYGGVVFIYNSTHIDIFISHRNNRNMTGDNKKWAAIFTGSLSAWAGPANFPRIYETINVQARAWKSRDLPPAAWKSETINVDSGTCLAETLRHSLNKYPDFVVVQIRNGNRIAQAQGLSSLSEAKSRYHHIGGVIFGTNESHIQLWSAGNITETMFDYALVAIADGWGQRGYSTYVKAGSVTVTAWDLAHFERNKLVVKKSLQDIEDGKYLQKISENLTAYNLFNVQVLDGKNQNFRFDGIGSVMSEVAPYGGLIYGHNDSAIAIWVPHPDTRTTGNSAIFTLGNIWGRNFQSQMTNNVDVVITVMDVMVPVCVLEVNITTTEILTSSKYYMHNNSIFAVGEKITMYCKSGYEALEGNITMICEAENNGSWDREPVNCEVPCADPFVPNTVILQSHHFFGGRVEYACTAGFKHVSGDLTRSCEENGIWNGTAPVCENKYNECMCPCTTIGTALLKINETEELNHRIKELRSSLSVRKNMTVKARMRKISASDPRTSALGVGVVLGIGSLVAVISSLVIQDILALICFIRRRINSHVKR